MTSADRLPVDEERLVDADHPWPGLVPFREAHSGFFFGRGTEQEELFRCVRRGTTTQLFGQSGLGKTSLLQAGLFPRLRENGYLPILVRLDYATEAQPLSEQVKLLLKGAIAEAGFDAARTIGPDESLWEYLHRRELPLVDRDGGPIIPVIVFDQFEEFFSLGFRQRKADCQQFQVELSDLIENRAPALVKARLDLFPEQIGHYVFNREDYRLIVTLREDYLPALEVFRAGAPSLGRNRFRLTALKGPQALEAVVVPGHGIVSEDVARRIVRLLGAMRPGDAAASPSEQRELDDVEVESSLLSLFCSELNERRIAERSPEITAELVEANRQNILKSFYERELKDRPPALREFIEDQLVTDSGARDSIARERAEKILADKGVPPGALDDLVRRRVLHIEERREGPRVELIHDVLLDVVRQGKNERSQAALRRALAQTRKRYMVRAAAVAAVVIAVAGGVVYVARQNAEQARREAERAQVLVEATAKMARITELTNAQLKESNEQLTAYRDRVKSYLSQLMLVLEKYVEGGTQLRLLRGPQEGDKNPSDAGPGSSTRASAPSQLESLSTGTEKFLDTDVRKLLPDIIKYADELLAAGDDAMVGIKARALIVSAKLPNNTDAQVEEYLGAALPVVAKMTLQATKLDGVVAGYDTFESIRQLWDNRGKTELALAVVEQTIDTLGRVDPRVLKADDRNWYVASAIQHKARLLRRASRLDDAEAALRWGLREIAASPGAQAALLLSVAADLHNDLGDLLQSARTRTTDDAAKRSAADAAMVEFELAWKAGFDYYQVGSSTNPTGTRNWLAKLASRIGLLAEDIHDVEKARRYYRQELRIRRLMVPEETSPPKHSDETDRAKRDVASAQINLGYLERTQGDKAKAIEILSACVGEATILAEDNPSPVNQQSLGFCYFELANVYRDLKNQGDARTNFDFAAIRLELALPDRSLTRSAHWLVLSWRRLADAVTELDGPDQALQYLDKAVTLARTTRQKAQTDETNEDFAAAQRDLAYAQRTIGFRERTKGDPVKAAKILNECVLDAISLVADMPTPLNQQSLGYCYIELANVYADLKDQQQARKAFAGAASALELSWADRTLDRSPHWLIYAWRRLGSLVAALESAAEGTKTIDKAVGLARQMYQRAKTEETTDDLVLALGNKSWTALLASAPADAKSAAEEALALDSKPIWIRINLAHALWLQNQRDAAKAIYRDIKDQSRGKTGTYADDIRQDFATFLGLRLVGADQVREIDQLLAQR